MLVSIYESIRDFLELGGPVLQVIFVVAVCLWALLLERFWYLRVRGPRLVREAVDIWRQRRDTTSWYAKKVRSALIADVSIHLKQFLVFTKTLVAACPLLGILGTVTGMIRVFDVMAFAGTGNARGMAAGISQATLPTMAGLVVAISGLYLISWLERKAETETQSLADQLRHF
jgi:biopolymer transport protein ExbB